MCRLLNWSIHHYEHRLGAATLHAALIEPISAEIEDKAVLIIPDGALAELPFGALDPALPPAPLSPAATKRIEGLLEAWDHASPPATEAESNDPDVVLRASLKAEIGRTAAGLRSENADALFDHLAPTVCYSVSLAIRLAQPLPSGSAPLLAIADPAGPWKPLPSARAEVEAVAAVLGVEASEPIDPGVASSDAEILGGKDATVLNLTAAIERRARSGTAHYQVMHVAAHGVRIQRTRRPHTGAASSDVAIALHGGLLTTFDLALMRIRTFVTSLLCCHTRVGSLPDRSFRDPGLALSFHLAGATYVLASTGAIPDASTPAFARHFYESLLQGMSAGSALAYAQERTRADYPMPIAWAPFVISGPGPLVSFADRPGMAVAGG